jgi:hypothetical protein
MGEKLQNLKPREAKGLLHAQPREARCLLRGQPREAESLLRGLRGQPREAKPFTRAKWEIRFQRFALSFRPLASITEKVILCQYSGHVSESFCLAAD